MSLPPDEFLAVLLHRQHRTFGVTLTAADIAAYQQDAASGEAVLVTRELGGAVDLRMVSQIEAKRMHREGWT